MKEKNFFHRFCCVVLIILISYGCQKKFQKDPDVATIISTNQPPTLQSYTALLDVYEDNTASTDSIVTNKGYKTIYNLSVNAIPGDILRVRGQVEMTNDIAPFGQHLGGVLVRGNIRTLVDASICGSSASQNDVYYPDPDHHMHHMPLWSDGVYYVTHTGITKVEVQYATTLSSSNPTVKIEPFPFGTTTPYGHLVVEHYRKYDTRQSAQQASAYALDSLMIDKNEKATTFSVNPAKVYSVQCDVIGGDIVRMFGQATSRYLYRLALHGQGIFRNGSLISPYATENNISRIPDLPLWTDAIDKPSSNGTNEYFLRLHSLLAYGSASVVDAGYLYGLRFRKLGIATNPKQLAESKIISGPQSTYPIVANSGWHQLITYSGQGKAGDILKVTGFAQFAGTNAFQDGINCQFRIKVNGEITQSGKYVTELTEVVPLRSEVLKVVNVTGTYTIQVDVLASRQNANPTVSVVGGKSGIIIDRFTID